MAEYSAVSLRVLLVIVVAVWAVEAQQFSLTHRYSHLEGSPARTGGEGVSQEYFETLVAHDRRRLVSVVNFPLNGSFLTTALYHTQISLGTPPRQYSVYVDTGSDISWVKCAPCPSCPLQSATPGFTFTQYDPNLSSTEKVLPCGSPDCEIAQNGVVPLGGACGNPVSPQACSYGIRYVSGETSLGYFLTDVMTFNLVVNGTPTVTTADVYFGCSHNLTGFFISPRFLDGLMGFGVGAITIPNQIATQKKTSRSFAHCLQGNGPEGSRIVMGNITEPGIVYTPIVPDQRSYFISMHNIAVNGVNITTPASFDIVQDGRGGVIVDTGTNFVILMQPAYDEFVAAVVNYRGIPIVPIKGVFEDREEASCFLYNGSLDEVFPKVKLLFDGGAVMNLGPLNYLVPVQLISGERAHCIAWFPSSLLTIFGNIVLQDQLVVYDMDKLRVGWKPFNCSKSFSVGGGLITTVPRAQAPSSSIQGSSFGAKTKMSINLLSSCLVVAFFLTTLL